MTTTQALKMREIPPQMRARLAAAGAACAAAPETDKTRHIAEIDAITDDLARLGVVHRRSTERPEFCPAGRPSRTR